MTSAIGRGEGVKNWSNLLMDSTKKLPTWGRGGGGCWGCQKFGKIANLIYGWSHSSNNNYANFGACTFWRIIIEHITLLWIFWQKGQSRQQNHDPTSLNCNKFLNCEKQVFVLFVYTIGHFPGIFCKRGQKSAEQWLKYLKLHFCTDWQVVISHLWISAKI